MGIWHLDRIIYRIGLDWVMGYWIEYYWDAVLTLSVKVIGGGYIIGIMDLTLLWSRWRVEEIGMWIDTKGH